MLFVSLDYPPNDGGISRLAAGAVRALAVSGIELRVVTLTAGGRIGPERPEVPTIEVARRKGPRDLQILRHVMAYLRAHGRDAPILTSVWNPEATLALLAGAQRVSILAHGNEVMPVKAPRAWLRRLVLSRAHCVICNSRFTADLVQTAAPRSRVTVLNPAVDADRFMAQTDRAGARAALGLAADQRIILTVARLDPIKGHDTVLRALSMLPQAARQTLRYVIIGKGGMLEPLRQLAHELGVAEQVDFRGFVAEDELPLWYAAADLFALCSVVDRERRGMEGFGMALTEAQAAGLAVIGTRSGGIPDAIREGEGGWLIAERDADALAGYLDRLVKAPDNFAEQGRLGALRVRREMSWANYAARLAELV